MKAIFFASSLALATLASGSPASYAPPSQCDKVCGPNEICVVVPNTRRSICVVPQFCGGFAAIPCEVKTDICVDDPRDTCDPKHGGADCGGVCIPGDA